MTRCQCRAACDELYYDVAYSLARWPAPGYEGDAVWDYIFNTNRFEMASVTVPPPYGALSDTAIRPSVCLSVPWRSCPRL